MTVKVFAGYEHFKRLSYLNRLEEKYYENVINGSVVFEIKHFLSHSQDLKKQIIRPFLSMYPDYLISSRHNLAVCLIPKNMSTLMSRILCLLNRSLEESMANQTLTASTARRCADSIRYSTLDQVRSRFIGKDPENNLILTRDPLERFLSAFMMLCIIRKDPCFGCFSDMRCVSEKLIENAERFSREDRSDESNALWHMAPQNWHCDLNGETNSYEFLDYSSLKQSPFLNSLGDYLRRSDVDESIVQRILSDMSLGHTSHQTILDKSRVYYEKMLMNSSEIKRNLLYVYFYDYVLFLYSFPKI